MLAWARRRSRSPMRGRGPVSCVGASVWRAARASVVIGGILLPDSKRGINVTQDESKTCASSAPAYPAAVRSTLGRSLSADFQFPRQQAEHDRVAPAALE